MSMMKALITDHSGEKPVMVMGEHPQPKPGKNELLVKIKATSLNRADLLQKAGKYPPPKGESSLLGLEMSGVVAEAGTGTSKFKKGDRVFGLLGGGGYAEYSTIYEELAMPVPDELSYEEAAAIPEVFLTAFQAINRLGELQEGETILIHAGASGVGTAAIQLARKLYDSRIAVTAGSDEKLELCRSLGADLAMNYKKEDHAAKIEAAFGKNAVDMVLDVVGAPYWDKNMKVLAMDGRLVYLAMLGGTIVEKMSLVPVLRKRLTIKGSTLRNRTEDYKIKLTADFNSQAMKLIETGEIKPVIDSVYHWSECENAHQKMENNLNAGKIILTGM